MLAAAHLSGRDTDLLILMLCSGVLFLCVIDAVLDRFPRVRAFFSRLIGDDDSEV